VRALASLLIISLCLSVVAADKEPLQEYKSRRERLARKVDGGVIVVFAAPDRDLVEYQQESNFYYLTGFDEPDAVMIIDASSTPEHDYLFLKPRNLSQERWTGAKLGPGEDTQRAAGVDSAEPIAGFPDFLRKISSTKPVFTLKTDISRVHDIVPDVQVQDVAPAIAELRQVKAPTEIALLEKAVAITLKGHEAAARAIAPGVMEYEVRGALEYEFRRNGAERPGYPSIVGSGPLSTVLHYDKSRRRMEAGDVVVVDVGAEYSGYSADITRTYPVSGRFSPRQREIYQIVLEAEKRALAQVRPGATLSKIHAAAFDYIKAKGYSRYFIHSTSHHIGLQVHDVGSTTRPLEPNMVITTEPGIYIPEEKLGIRIEDDVLVTPSGYRILSDFPKEPDEIEALVQKKP